MRIALGISLAAQRARATIGALLGAGAPLTPRCWSDAGSWEDSQKWKDAA